MDQRRAISADLLALRDISALRASMVSSRFKGPRRLVFALGFAVHPALAALGLMPPVQAQSLATIDGPSECQDCSIRLVKVATLGTVSDPVLLSSRARLTRDSKGNFYAAPSFEPGKIVVFDSLGRFVRAIGKAGEGPNEFAAISYHRIGPADTLHVVDASNRRYSKMLHTGHVAAATAIEISNSGSITILRTGEIVGSEFPRSGQTPIAVFGQNGVRKGLIAGHRPAGESSFSEFHVAPDSSAVWVAPVNAYRIEKWSLDGRRAQFIGRSVPWFPEWRELTAAMDQGREPMPPRLAHVVATSPLTIWTFVAVPDLRFRPLAPGERVNPATMNSLVDTYVEVLDVARRRAVVTQRFPEYLSPFNGDPSHVFSARYNSDGVIVLDVFRTQVVSPR